MSTLLELEQEKTQQLRGIIRTLIIVICLMLAALLAVKCDADRQEAGFAKLQNALADTISHYKNKEGQLVARISVLETEKISDFLSLKTKDVDVIELQKLVSQYKQKLKGSGSATVFSTQGKYEEKSTTTGTVYENLGNNRPDTNPNSNNTRGYLALPYNFHNKDTTWFRVFLDIKADTTHLSLQYKDKYKVVIGEESQGLFKKKKTFVDVISENPYNKVKKLRTYQVERPRPKNWHIGPFAGYGIGNDFTGQVFVGAGVMWTPINF